MSKNSKRCNEKQTNRCVKLSSENLQTLRRTFREAVKAHGAETVLAQMPKGFINVTDGAPISERIAAFQGAINGNMQFNDVGRIQNALKKLGKTPRTNKYEQFSRVGEAPPEGSGMACEQ